MIFRAPTSIKINTNYQIVSIFSTIASLIYIGLYDKNVVVYALEVNILRTRQIPIRIILFQKRLPAISAKE